MNPEDDHDLLGRLRRALEPEPQGPPAERVEAVRARAVAGSELRVAAERARRRTRLVSVAAVVAILAALTWGFALGVSTPEPLRATAHNLGLPVESPELVEARSLLHDLGVALSNEQPDRVARTDRQMLAVVETLDENEQSKIVPVAHEVHVRAIEFLRRAGKS